MTWRALVLRSRTMAVISDGPTREQGSKGAGERAGLDSNLRDEVQHWWGVGVGLKSVNAGASWGCPIDGTAHKQSKEPTPVSVASR